MQSITSIFCAAAMSFDSTAEQMNAGFSCIGHARTQRPQLMQAFEVYWNTFADVKKRSPEVVFVVAISRWGTLKPIIGPPLITLRTPSFSPPQKATRSA